MASDNQMFRGIADIAGSFKIPAARAFLFLLGIVNILIAVIILTNSLALPILLAWFVLFWGASRLFLSMTLRKAFK